MGPRPINPSREQEGGDCWALAINAPPTASLAQAPLTAQAKTSRISLWCRFLTWPALALSRADVKDALVLRAGNKDHARSRPIRCERGDLFLGQLLGRLGHAFQPWMQQRSHPELPQTWSDSEANARHHVRSSTHLRAARRNTCGPCRVSFA